MSRWNGAAARLNRAADAFYAELISILRPAAGSAYVKGGATELIAQLHGVITEGEAVGPADGEAAGDRNFNARILGGGLEASFMRTGFAALEHRPRKDDVLRVETGPRAGDEFVALSAAADDGDRINVPLIRRS